MSNQKATPQPEDTTPKAEETATNEPVEAVDIDSLIDDIDDVLEENAEEFVKNFVQRGGE